MTHPDDRELQAREVERLRRGAKYQRFDYRIVRADGSTRHLRTTLAEIEQKGKPHKFLGTVQDVTDQRRTDSEIAALVAVSEAIVEWESFDQGIGNLLRKLAEALDCVAGVLWVPVGDELVARVFWRKHDFDVADDFEAATRRLRVAKGQGLPGSVWKSGTPSALKDLGEFQGHLRNEGARTAGLRNAVAFAVLDGAEVLAVVELYSCEDAEPSERLMRSLVSIGHELGQFLKHRRGELGSALLTAREVVVLQLAARGTSAAQIAQLLTISRATVKTHFEHIYAKLEVPDRAAAVAKAVRSGLVE
ncbi:MAG: two-component system, cell cycle sensor histidine kinase and response regulator CckA [Chloroflexota bacterium]|jgi:DNA-binding CsgD family transcriptional regulator|nr:two-component system, cell cycle sensor histidine kinase and response regulator CckA [Chloroflexota bacterium]